MRGGIKFKGEGLDSRIDWNYFSSKDDFMLGLCLVPNREKGEDRILGIIVVSRWDPEGHVAMQGVVVVNSSLTSNLNSISAVS